MSYLSVHHIAVSLVLRHSPFLWTENSQDLKTSNKVNLVYVGMFLCRHTCTRVTHGGSEFKVSLAKVIFTSPHKLSFAGDRSCLKIRREHMSYLTPAHPDKTEMCGLSVINYRHHGRCVLKVWCSSASLNYRLRTAPMCRLWHQPPAITAILMDGFLQTRGRQPQPWETIQVLLKDAHSLDRNIFYISIERYNNLHFSYIFKVKFSSSYSTNYQFSNIDLSWRYFTNFTSWRYFIHRETWTTM